MKPEIRFEGFEDEWTSKRISSIVEIIDGDRGTNYPSNSDLFKSGHTLFLSANNISSLGFKDSEKVYITKDKSNQMGNGKVIIGDIVITTRGTIGNVVYFNKDIFNKYPNIRINSGMLILRGKDLEKNNLLFIEKYLNSPIGKQQVSYLSFGSAQPQLTKKDVSNYEIKICSLNEQEKMSELLSKLARNMSAKELELTKLKEFKQAMLQKMFPKEGQTVPEIRFDGFDGEWEQITINGIGEIITGNTPATLEGENYSCDGLLWVTPTDINSLITSNSEKRLSKTGTLKARIVPKGSILVTCIASIGKNTLVLEKAGFNQQINALVPKENYDSYFLLTLANFWSKQMKKIAGSGTMEIVNRTEFSKIVTIIPCNEEQKLIGKYFYVLDKNIETKQQQLTKLKQLKQSLLDKMFV